jgi:hypothetical protein
VGYPTVVCKKTIKIKKEEKIMKMEKNCFISAVATVMLSIPVLGDIQLIQSDKPRVNPALVGIEQLYVFTVQPDAEPNKDGLVWEVLDGKAELKLKEAGIKTAQISYLGGRAAMDHNIPQLRIYIDMLKPSDSQQYVFHIRTSLVSSVSLVKQPSCYIKADIWKAESAMQAVSVQDMPAKITDEVLQQVSYFINAYNAANVTAAQQSDAKGIALMDQQQNKKAVQAPIAEYKYVASKNGKVFHKPECPWAQRIKPENLIVYDSREDAIEKGKRPCNRCKP